MAEKAQKHLSREKMVIKSPYKRKVYLWKMDIMDYVHDGAGHKGGDDVDCYVAETQKGQTL